MALPNPGMNFTPFDVLPASDLNDIVENVEALSTGSGFSLGNNVIPANALSTSAITLGYAQITANFTTTSTTYALVTGLSVTVTIPSGGRRVKITAYTNMYHTAGGQNVYTSIWDGTVGSGTQLSEMIYTAGGANFLGNTTCIAVTTPSAGSKTYNVGIRTASSGTAGINAQAVQPAFILVQAI